MLPLALLQEDLVRADGCGPSIDVTPQTSKLLVLTLGITRIMEKESLDVSIWGSSDGKDWGYKPLAAFPRKSYCGLYSKLLNLAAFPEITHLRVQWKMNRWAVSAGLPPVFEFYVHAEESGARMQAAVA